MFHLLPCERAKRGPYQRPVLIVDQGNFPSCQRYIHPPTLARFSVLIHHFYRHLAALAMPIALKTEAQKRQKPPSTPKRTEGLVQFLSFSSVTHGLPQGEREPGHGQL